jgi:hypothetical protein
METKKEKKKLARMKKYAIYYVEFLSLTNWITSTREMKRFSIVCSTGVRRKKVTSSSFPSQTLLIFQNA